MDVLTHSITQPLNSVIGELSITNWATFLTRLQIRGQVGKSHLKQEAGLYLVLVQMEMLLNQRLWLDCLCSPSTPRPFFFYAQLCKKNIHSDELGSSELPFPKWSTRAHRPWIWPSLAWIAIISPNAPAAPVSAGPSDPVAVVSSGSSVPAAGTSTGIGALALAHFPAFQLGRAGGNWPLPLDLDLALLLIVLRNYLHKVLSPPAWGLLFGFWSLILQI